MPQNSCGISILGGNDNSVESCAARDCVNGIIFWGDPEPRSTGLRIVGNDVSGSWLGIDVGDADSPVVTSDNTIAESEYMGLPER